MTDEEAYARVRHVIDTSDVDTAQVWLLALAEAYKKAIAAKAARHMLAIGEQP
jgi:hypothetical protein